MTTSVPRISHAPGGLLVIGDDGRILQSPEFFQRALFLDQREAPSIYHLFDPMESPFLVLSRVFRHPYGGIEYHLRVDGLFGHRHGFRYWPVPRREEQGNQGPWEFFIVDDSSIIQTHDWDFRRLRRNILSDMKESLSTQFKNRLSAVQLLAETLRDAPEIAAESAPRLLQSIGEVHRVLNLVLTGIDDIRSPMDYEDAPVRLSDLSSAIHTRGNRDVTITCSLNDVSPATLIPASSIERILFPIVDNAIDASSKGSTVDVVISEMDKGFAHFEVIDSGEGMTERVRNRAQDPFFTTRSGHLGLGLSHAREALRDAGGQWKIESAPREGTRITILLPVTTAAQPLR